MTHTNLIATELSNLVQIDETIHCNRCDKAFNAPKKMNRDGFCGQKAARISEFCTCPLCQQTDCHWVYASDTMPKFEGNFEIRKRLSLKWLLEN